MKLDIFSKTNFLDAVKALFTELNVPVNYISDEPTTAKEILKDTYKDNDTFELVNDVYFVGMVDDAAFEGEGSIKPSQIEEDYEAILIFAITLYNRDNNLLPSRSQFTEITRAFNREFKYTPVVIVFNYRNNINEYIAFANTERIKYKHKWLEGEKAGKISLLRDINIREPHSAHTKILFGDEKNKKGLQIDSNKIKSYDELYRYWQSVFTLQELNDHFYKDLQDWFYYALQHINLPFKPEYISEKENAKNFLVRLLARTMFCWFVKEKELIKPELLELTDWQGKRYKLTKDVDDNDFLKSNSYYRGVLQNIFFNALNQNNKKTIKDFKWTKYLHPDFNIEWFAEIPYLNGGIFDKLEEDNAKESIEDSVISIPNFLFYGIEEEQSVIKGRGKNKHAEIEKVEHKGLNHILKSYKFTLEENTPFEEDIALDPEMLGLVFENLLAELDPNLEESVKKSIRKLTGSYYTPRKVIYEMVNDSLNIYLSKFIENNYQDVKEPKKKVSDLVYFNKHDSNNTQFAHAVVAALDKYKVLDPACGSGAFPMGMLHRMVDILQMVDEHNERWIDLKLRNVDAAQRSDFKKVLSTHLNDYGRKLGIIRDSIYGIDIQPMAVQITKLRFFISLLIDQKTEKGITPMPNIETKIICADTLKNIQPDLFSTDAIQKLTEARTRYYQPDISFEEREQIANDIIEILDQAFPAFAKMITGKHIPGQNKELLRHWFTHSTLAAPFFNVDFFYPELKETGGFDCVIGNPPYGGFKITDDVRNTLNIESKDPYGAFIARFLNSATETTPLKKGGVLAYIVSDTFMTIKSHLKLRKHLMQNYVHKMLRVHPDTFRATVNTVLMVAERNTYPKDKANNFVEEFNANHVCLMADMTNISIHENYEHFIQVLNQTKGVNFQDYEKLKNISYSEYAIYYYPQSLINNNSNLPFFVASPTLFNYQNNSNPLENKVKNEPSIIYKNKESLKLYKIGETYSGSGKNKKWNGDGLFKVISGIKTGNNSKYLYENPKKDLVISDDDAVKLSKEEAENGIMSEKEKAYVSFELGKSSDTKDGILPCYYQEPSDVFIDWSSSSVTSMKNESHSDLANKEFRFVNLSEQLSFSTTGQYAPTFRISVGMIFLNKASRIFLSNTTNNISWLGLLNSKLFKYFTKNFSNHSVEFGVEDLKSIIFIDCLPIIEHLAKQIVENQKNNPLYDYASNEQIEIDKLVYQAYGLNADDVQEVENWYARRYPKLSAAQKANLRKLGKSDDYLELYGMK